MKLITKLLIGFALGLVLINPVGAAVRPSVQIQIDEIVRQIAVLQKMLLELQRQDAIAPSPAVAPVIKAPVIELPPVLTPKIVPPKLKPPVCRPSTRMSACAHA